MPSCSILLAMSTLNDMETHSVEMPIDSDDVICGIEREKVAATLNLYLADFRMNMRREESDEAKTVLNSIQCPVFFFRLRFSIITSTESDKGFPGIWRTGMPIEKNVGLYFVSLFFVWHISQASSLILPSQPLSFSLVQVYYYREREYPLTCPHCLFGHIWFISSVALIQNVESFNHWRFWRILSRKVQPTFTNHLLVIGGICRWLGGDLPTF